MTRSASQWCLPLISLSLFLAAPICQAKTILVLAPHPDDEAVCCLGVIYSALHQGDAVYIVALTNGDHDGMSTGLLREGETVKAMSMPRVDTQHIIFLGFGDGGTLQLYQSADPNQVYTSIAGATATYGDQPLIPQPLLTPLRRHQLLIITYLWRPFWGT